MNILSRLRDRLPQLLRTTAALAAIGTVGTLAHDSLRGDCCAPGAPCCHPGAPCCASHHPAQK
jgi:hypothetical protein